MKLYSLLYNGKVLMRKQFVAIVDVTVPFENGYEAFQAARREKKRNYAPIADH